MAHLKSPNESGFMLMEVLITIAVIGVMLTPIFMMQNGALRGISRYSNKIRLLFPAKNFAVETVAKIIEKKDKELSGTKQISNPSATLTYKIEKVDKNSVFKDVKDIRKVEVSVQASRRGKETLIGFVYKPEREKK